jgi:molecular chaperone HtpG
MNTQEHGFKAEVQQLLDLMIHSVYSNRDVFLRELISNAADALDKIRFVELTESGLVPAAHDNPGVRLKVDADARTITIEDDGVGMTAEEAIAHLGTIAHSGTKAFTERLKAEGASGLPNLIGQFGVGFYSSFMVADEVVVESRSAKVDAEGVRWTSKGAGTYTVEPIERAARGTTIVLKLREDAAEYADDNKVRAIVRAHSNYVSWPVLLGEEQINAAKALWMEPTGSVTDEEAREFYRSLTFDWEAPLLRVHASVDSPIQYNALLFIPKNRPYDLFMPETDRGPRLYARRVLIAEHAKDLLPDWLRFVRGVVDSEDIALNVSREMIQKTPVVRKIREALTKRILKDLGRFAEREPDAPEEGEEAPEAVEHPYHTFWKSFGILIKEGYYHAHAEHGERLLPLLRFNTLNHLDGSGLSSLKEYKDAMPEGQDAIWYLTAESREAALTSPHLEAFRKKGWNVLLLTDTVDEWFVQSLESFDGVEVKSITRGELSLDDDETAEKADLSSLGPWMHSLFDGVVASVRPSNRLTDSAAVLVDDADGISSNMERILRQANQDYPGARRHLELNVKHPLIRDLAMLHERGATDTAEPIARLLLDDALLLEGTVKDAPAIGRRLQALLERTVSAAVQAQG